MSANPSAFHLPSLTMIRRSGGSQRATPRHRQSGLTCNLGDVIDLSAAGMRVRCRHSLDRRVEVVLTDYTRPGQLAADVAWCRPIGNFHYEVGLKFRKVTRAMATRLGSIAMTHRFRKAI